MNCSYKKKMIILFLFFIFSLNAEIKVAICAIFKNEAPYLREWIEYHKLIGVERFYLYNNNSSDNYKDVLKPYIKNKEVVLVDWNYSAHDLQSWNDIQCSAYTDCIKNNRKRVDWLAIIDIDEFIVLSHATNLATFLEPYKKYGGLCVNWQLFGTANIQQIPANQLLIEALTLKAQPTYPENIHVKSIVRPKCVSLVNNPHYPIYNPSYFGVNSDGQRIEGAFNPAYTLDKIRIHHYWSRDEAYFYAHKVSKRSQWGEPLEAQLQRVTNLNQVYDGTMLKIVPKLRQKLGL